MQRLALPLRARSNAAMTIAGPNSRIFSPGEAAAAARAFDLKRLPADFIDDPFPYYAALREPIRCTACRTARIC
jgi:hypothetical protein